MTRKRPISFVAPAALSIALLAAACGGSSSGSGASGDNATAATIDAGIKNGVEAALNGVTTTVAGAGATTTTTAVTAPTTMDEWEALWAKQRAAVVKNIKDNKWGKSADGKTLTGPEGWTVDLSKCPTGWSDTEGLSDTSIKVGQAIALSGSYAEYGNYAKSQKMMFDYYGGKGMFKDSQGKTRTVDYVIKDDGYDAARTIPLVDEFIDSDKVFAMWTLGSPNTLKVYDKLNQRCIPNPIAITGHAAWGDPVNHPWTTGAPALSYSSEAVLWGNFLESHLSEFPADRKLVVAALVANNDFGRLYEGSFKAYVAQSAKLKDRVDFQEERIEAQAPTATDPMTTLGSKNPDVFIAMVAATLCTQAVTEAAQNGMQQKVKYLFQPQTCAGTSFVKKEKVGGDGSAANGWWIVNPGFKDLTDKSFQQEPFIQWARQQLTAQGDNPDSSSLFSGGVSYGWTFVQALLIAQQLDGGLTRSNFMLAQRAIDMTSPMFPPNVHFHMNGDKDAYFIEAGGYQQWDAANQTWVLKTPVVDLDGQSKPCAWDAGAGLCK